MEAKYLEKVLKSVSCPCGKGSPTCTRIKGNDVQLQCPACGTLIIVNLGDRYVNRKKYSHDNQLNN